MPLYKTLIFFILLLVSSSSILAFRYAFFLFLKWLLASRLTLFRLSTLLWFGSCTHCILACFLWSKKNVNILHQTMVYGARRTNTSQKTIFYHLCLLPKTLHAFDTHTMSSACPTQLIFHNLSYVFVNCRKSSGSMHQNFLWNSTCCVLINWQSIINSFINLTS